MKKVILFLFLGTYLFAELSYEGYLGVDMQAYNKTRNKHSSNFTLEQKLKLTYERNNFISVLELYAQEDSSDYNSKTNNDRSYLRINELYTSYEFEDSKILFGKSILFWGALEVKNIVDGFNIQDKRTDPSKTDKIGAYNIQYSHYFEESELSLIVKLYEQKSKMANASYTYSILGENERLKNKLESEKSLYRPSVYVTYTGSLSDDIALDYAFIVQNGYDSQRYLRKIANEYSEHAYLVNKFSTYNTLVLGSALIKLEFLYTDVLDDKNVADYYHSAFGLEYTLEQFEAGSELAILGEYYYYKSKDERISSDLSRGEIFQNDLFLGLRYSLNDYGDSTAVGGVIIDTDYKEENYYVEFETRLYDAFKVKLDLSYTEPSKTHNTIYAQQGRSKKIGLNIAYYY